MNVEQQIKKAIEQYVERYPQPNLAADAAQVVLTRYIHKALEDLPAGTYNQDQLNFFSVFDGGEHK